MQAQGIHLRRLIYISKEEYKILRGLRDSCLKRWERFFGRRSKPRTNGKKKRVGWPTRRDLDGRYNKILPGYEASKIWDTRDSMMWKWRRVREYYKEFVDEKDEKAIKEKMYRLMYS